MRVLVTGGAGYIGSHTVRHLLEHGHEVTVFDNLSKGHAASVPADILVEGSLSDSARLDHILVTLRIQAVIHFAAFAQVGESVQQPDLYYRNNVLGTFNLLDAMEKAGVRRMVFSSTCATYGIPETMPIVEATPQNPINPYGRTKLMVEWMLEDMVRHKNWACASLRYFNAAGADPKGDIGEDHTPETHLIPLAIFAAMGKTKGLEIFGDDYPTPDGTCIRDYIHVLDLAQAHRLALEKICPASHLKLNLGTGKGQSVRDVIDAVRKVSGLEVPFRMGKRREGDPPSLVACSDLARNTLGWNPQYLELEKIVETAWRWHMDHPNGYA